MLTTWVVVDPDCQAKSLWVWLLLYLSNLKSLLSWGITLAFSLPYFWSSSTRLYSTIRSMSRRILFIGFLVNDFLKSCLVGRPTLKVLMATSSKSFFFFFFFVNHFVHTWLHSQVRLFSIISQWSENIQHWYVLNTLTIDTLPYTFVGGFFHMLHNNNY